MYGQGVYFSLSSNYSDSYTRSSCKTMFRCKVLVGFITKGDSTMKVPPNNKNNKQYDSTGDGQSIFVCYHDSQCYPEYIITYNL